MKKYKNLPHEYKVGKFMRNTLPPRIAVRTQRKRSVAVEEEAEQQPTLKKIPSSSSADRMLGIALQYLNSGDLQKVRLYIQTARNIIIQKGR